MGGAGLADKGPPPGFKPGPSPPLALTALPGNRRPLTAEAKGRSGLQPAAPPDSSPSRFIGHLTPSALHLLEFTKTPESLL